jgi:tetratricopeptide (TPR) repeat protein
MRPAAAALGVLVLLGAGWGGYEAYQRSGPAAPLPASLEALDPLVRARLEEVAAHLNRRRRSADAWLWLARVAEGNGLFGEAETCLRRVLELRPEDARALHRLACVEERTGNLERAVATMARAAEADPRVPWSWARLAWWSLDLGDVERASQALDRARELDPRAPVVRLATVRLDLARGDGDAAARRLAEDGLLTGPDAAFANALLAQALRLRGDLEGAAAAHARSDGKRYVLDDPWAREVREEETGYAAQRLRAGRDVAARRFAQAEPKLGEILAHDPRDTTALDLLAVCRLEQGDPDSALALLEMLFTIEPSHDEAAIHHARALLASGQASPGALATARERLGGALERRADDPVLWRLAAALAEAGQDPAGVLAALDRVVELAPDATDMRIRAAYACIELGRHEEALTRFRAVEHDEPSQLEAWYGEALALVRAGRTAEAEAAIEALADRPGVDPRRVEALRRP